MIGSYYLNDLMDSTCAPGESLVNVGGDAPVCLTGTEAAAFGFDIGTNPGWNPFVSQPTPVNTTALLGGVSVTTLLLLGLAAMMLLRK
jgi:hypothetical protein